MISDYTKYRITQTRFKLLITARGIHQYQITQIIRLCDIRLRDSDYVDIIDNMEHILFIHIFLGYHKRLGYLSAP